MKFYSFNIGDYARDTLHLEPLEDLAYRRMLDLYYAKEMPLPKDIDEIARLIRMRSHCESIKVALQDFFYLEDDGWHNFHADQEIAKFLSKSEKARKSAKARWLKNKKKKPKSEGNANALQTDSEGNANALQTDSEGNATQDPIPNTQDTKKSKKEIADMLLDFWLSRSGQRIVKRDIHHNMILARLNSGYEPQHIQEGMLKILNDKWYINEGELILKNVCSSDKRLEAALAIRSENEKPKPDNQKLNDEEYAAEQQRQYEERYGTSGGQGNNDLFPETQV